MRLLSRLSAYGLQIAFWLAMVCAFLSVSVFVDIQRESHVFTEMAAAVRAEWAAKTQTKRLVASVLASAWAEPDEPAPGASPVVQAARLAAADADILQIDYVNLLPGESGMADDSAPAEFHTLYRRGPDANVESGGLADRLRALLQGARRGRGRRDLWHVGRIDVGVDQRAAVALFRSASGGARDATAWVAIVYRPPEITVPLPRRGTALRVLDRIDGAAPSVVLRAGPPSGKWEALLFPRLEYSTRSADVGIHLELEQQLGFEIIDWSRLRVILMASCVFLGLLLTLTAFYFRSERRLRDEGDRLFRLANFDPLTGLPNRLLFANRLEQALAAAHRGDHPLALLYLDLDGFKTVNDFYGHQIGDLVLQRAARIFRHCVRDMDTVARLGGDEFVILLQDVAGFHGAQLVARKIKRAFLSSSAENNRIKNLPMLGTSIGIAMYPDDGETPVDLLKSADRCMYRDKAESKEQAALMTQAAAE